MLTVRIEPRAGRALRAGHPWVYSNHVRGVEGGAAQPGDVVRVVQGPPGHERELGTAFYNPRSLIALRRFSLEGEAPTRETIARRLLAAESLRTRLFPGSNAWRVCHGEADFLPGLLVDRYADVCVVQALSAGMDRLLPLVAEALLGELGARSVVERNESAQRELEGLAPRSGLLLGAEPGVVRATLPPIELEVDPLHGQKTGAFLDQRENHAAAARHARGRRVYDAYCNLGGFALSAAAAGAEDVTGIDSSAEAVRAAAASAERLGLAARCRFVREDAEKDMEARHRRRERFGLVVLDPPSFTRSRQHVPAARRALGKLNARALTLVEPGGILVTSCCSHHVREETFHELIAEAAESVQRTVRFLEARSQAPDHPWLPALPESRYLKCVIAQAV